MNNSVLLSPPLPALTCSTCPAKGAGLPAETDAPTSTATAALTPQIRRSLTRCTTSPGGFSSEFGAMQSAPVVGVRPCRHGFGISPAGRRQDSALSGSRLLP